MRKRPVPDRRRLRARRVMAGALAAIAMCLGTVADAGQSEPSMRIDFTVTPAAGGVVEQDGLRVSYTLAEPVAGPASASGSRVIAGLQALFPEDRPHVIFDNGFEAASP